MARDNDFVVIQPPVDILRQTEADLKKEKEPSVSYNLKIWPGRGIMIANIPGERMRIWLGIHGQTVVGLLYVILVEELRDLCIALSTFVDPDGRYRIYDLDAYITLKPAAEGDTPQGKKERQDALLQPLCKLRMLGSVQVLGVESEVEDQHRELMTRLEFDEDVAYNTMNELISSGDQAREIGHFDVTNVYYRRASEYSRHFSKQEGNVFGNVIDSMALEFKIMQHRALNLIEANDFLYASQCAQTALQVANQLFLFNAPVSDPPLDIDGQISKGALRQWTCHCIKSGAARYGQRIKCEDIGRVYFSKSISEHLLFGEKATEQASEHKDIAYGCCKVSETVTSEENIPKEFMELGMRICYRPRADDSGEEDKREDEEREDEEWEDEED